ncbi:MAG: penicillin-binding transpeptidase domain-containing protein, partial [Chthoniobacteraceae bacterium]
MRQYPYGALAAHILGYVGEPLDMTQLPDTRDFDFYEPNVEGKAQIELSMDKYLRGTAGVRVMERSIKGSIGKELRVESPPKSNTVSLTIDARIQFIAEQALRAVGRAGAVVVDPSNGEILAMASVPSFDPNTFVPSIPVAEWKKLTDDETDPLTNRALSAFPPGSTFKLITSLAGLRQGLAKTTFNCSGGVSYGDHYFQCWKSSGHGRSNVTEAIKVSCNAFFYQYGNAAGIDSIDVVGRLLGLGQLSNIGLSGEQPGILPGPEWLKMNYPQERWSSAYTANVSIGQGFDLVSPLQLVMAYSAAANGGTAYLPRLVKTVTDGAGKPVLDEHGKPVIAPEPRVRARLSDSGITPADLELVRAGLWKVVNEDGGTARRARLDGGIVAGKTGTAQASLHGRQDTIAWFVCFAPFEKPKFAVCVMVQGGAHGGSVAAPIAAKIMEETLAMDRGDYQPTLAALPPARHRDPFRMLESINVESAITDDDEPAGPSTAGAAQRGGPAEFAAPRLKKPKAPTTREIPRARPVEPPPARKNFFQWLLGPKPGH